MLAAGFVKDDGTPNKRAFARALCRAANQDDGNQNVLQHWERNVYRWLDEKNPGGLSNENAELAAGVLGISSDELRLQPLVEQLQAQSQETDVLLQRLVEELAQLRQLVEENSAGIADLQQRIAGPRPVD